MTTDYAFIVDVQPDGAMQMRWISDSYTLITGRTIDEVKTGDLWKDVIAAEDWARFLEFMKWVIREKVAGEIECRSQRSEQHRTWLHIIVHPKLDAEGRLIIIGAVKDISWRKKAEEALSAEKERLAVTLRSIGDGVITTDTSGRIMLMNKIAEELTGWTHEEAQGRSLADVFTIINPLNRKICENPVALALSTRTTIELPTPTLLIRRDGREFMIADSGAPIKDRDGKVIGVVLVFRDMTEKNRLLEAAQKTQKLESLGILAGGIAHDFNNLLVGIYGYIDMARDQPTEARTSAFLDAAIATIGRAQSLTHQLLTFAKGGAPIRKTSPLFPFIKETVQFALSGSAVTCRFEVEPDLLLCDYDPNQLGQVIDNIVINAEQSMPAGGSIVIIAANRELHDHPRLPDGQYVAISIRDTGSGIPREIQERIFDPFFTTKQKGSGLGLAIAYSIITKHNGLIELESEPGRGSTFHIILPASSGHEPQPSPGPAGLLRGTGAILLMDDEKMILDTVGAMLKSLGFSVVSVQDGVEALRAFHEAWQAGRPFTAVILDLTIPGGMGGRETVKEIRQTDAAIPVFVMSGYADDTSLANAAGLGFTDGIQKPFIRAELSRLLSRYLPKK
jgi:PAS domain S-box-containing protein